MTDASEKVLAIADKFGASSVDFAAETESIQLLIELAKSGDAKTKTLVSGLIPQHITKFGGELTSSALDAQLDICEDSDVDVRIAGIRGMGKIISDVTQTELVERAMDAVLQLYITCDEDGNELNTLSKVLTIIINAKPVIFLHVALTLLVTNTPTEQARTKLYDLLRTTYNGSKSNDLRTHFNEFGTTLVTFLTSPASHALNTTEFNTFFNMLIKYNKKDVESIKTILCTRAKLGEAVTPESIIALSENVNNLSRFINTTSTNNTTNKAIIADVLVVLYNTVFSTLAYSNDTDLSNHVSRLVHLLVTVNRKLDPRQCNGVFAPFVQAFLSLMPVDAETYSYNVIASMMNLFHALASPLSDTLRDVTGLNVTTIQPSTVSAETRAERLAALQTALNKVITTLEAEMNSIEITKEARSRYNLYKAKLARERRLAAKAAKAAASATTSTDADADADADAKTEDGTSTTDADAHADTNTVAQQQGEEEEEESTEVDVAQAAVDAAVAAEVDGDADAADADADANTGSTDGTTDGTADAKPKLEPFSEEEAAAFKESARMRGQLRASLDTIKTLAQPILNNIPVFLTADQIHKRNETLVKKTKKPSATATGANKQKKTNNTKPQQQQQQQQQGKRKAGQQQQQQPQQKQGRGQGSRGRDSGRGRNSGGRAPAGNASRYNDMNRRSGGAYARDHSRERVRDRDHYQQPQHRGSSGAQQRGSQGGRDYNPRFDRDRGNQRHSGNRSSYDNNYHPRR